MGRENTIKWLASIEGKSGDSEDENQDVAEAKDEAKDWTRREDALNWDHLDPRKRTWKEAALYFWQSQKGRELSMGSSIIFAISLSVVGLACILSEALTEDSSDEVVDKETINYFFIVMYVGSIIAMVTLMVLGYFNKVTIDKGHKGHSNNFTKAGLTALGSGGIIYKGLVLAMYGAKPSCQTDVAFAKTALGAIFIITEVAFLMKHSSIRINYSLPMTLVSRLLLMLIIATNLCIWFNTIIEETLHDIHDDSGAHSLDAPESHIFGIMASETDTNDTECDQTDDLDKITSPYLFPLLIEFCVVASTMMLGVWEKSGLGLKVNEKIKKAKRDRIVAFTGVDMKEEEEDGIGADAHTEAMTTTGSTSHHGNSGHNSTYKNNNSGFLLGWLVLLAAVVVTAVGLYNAYSASGTRDVLINLTYGSNLAFTFAAAVALPVAFQQMSVLTHKDNEIKAERRRGNVHGTNIHVPERKVNTARRLDKGLITVTFYTLLAFKLMCMIAGYEEGDWLLFADGFVCIFVGLTQSTFIAWYAFEKRTTKEIHRATKPGRQALEFLRLCNLALWLVNTFLLKNRLAKGVLNRVFGREAWVIISNIVQPLTILYYFHCTMCIAEILHLCYTTKYIGIVRKSKQNAEASPAQSSADLPSMAKM